ncbi:MAG: nucleotide exchange factor GrpE [Smithella sp.]
MKRHKKEQNEQANETQNQAEEVSAGAGDHDSGSNDLTAKLAEKEKEAAANYDKYVRAVAELDNYKKRAVKEKNEILKYGKEEILKDILPFLDSLDRALEHAEASNDIKAFKEGLKLIQDQLFSCLKKHGVEAIECAGIAFDPNFHEAMMQMESADHEENEVINEFQRGYLLNGRLLRPSKVCVCKKINKENKVDEQIGENGE